MPDIVRQSLPIVTADDGAWSDVADLLAAAGGPLETFYSSLGCTGIILHISINAGTTFSLTFTLKHYNTLTEEATSTLIASAATTTNINLELHSGPGFPTTSNVSAGLPIGEYWSLAITGTTDTCTLDIVADLIP